MALGNSSTVERRTLTPLILVRIQVPQPLSLLNKISRLGKKSKTLSVTALRILHIGFLATLAYDITPTPLISAKAVSEALVSA